MPTGLRWKYVPNPDVKQPWFELDCELHEQAYSKGNSNVNTGDPARFEAYRLLNEAPDGLHNFRCIASSQKMAQQLGHAVERDVMRHRNRSAFRIYLDHVCLARREDAAVAVTLTSEVYRELGLTFSPVNNSWWVQHEHEHRFLEPQLSSIPGAGLGLFVRQGRLLRAGTVICEYAGCPTSRPQRGHEAYTVKLKSGRCISGLCDDGSVAHLAAIANDNGRDANCLLQEFEELPDRAFFVAIRDLAPGDEVFVQYGAAYWGRSSYRELEASDETRRKVKNHRSERRGADFDDAIAVKAYCRSCKTFVDRRVWGLHRVACTDPLVSKDLPFHELNCLPLNKFTACPKRASDIDHRRAVFFVTSAKASRAFTHEAIDTDP